MNGIIWVIVAKNTWHVDVPAQKKQLLGEASSQ
jgi:hypothetical protein